MRRVPNESDQPSSLLDRVVAALIGSISVGLTVVAIPLWIWASFWGVRFYTTSNVITGVLAWVCIVTISTAVVSFVLGSGRTIDLLSHLWQTGQPPNPGLTAKLWMGLIGLAVITIVVAVKSDVAL